MDSDKLGGERERKRERVDHARFPLPRAHFGPQVDSAKVKCDQHFHLAARRGNSVKRLDKDTDIGAESII